MLKKRFGDRTRLEQEYFARLRMINPIRSSSDTSGLHKLNDQVLVNIRGLETLGVKRSSFSSMLSDILLRALPHDIVLQYHRTRTAETPTPQADAPEDLPTDLDHLLKFLSTELENLEKSDFRSQRGRDSRLEYEAEKSIRPRDSKPTSCVLSSTSATSGEGCAFCKSELHITESCPADIPSEKKQLILSKETRCFRCTLKGHRARDCRRKITCKACAGRHASSVCSPRKNNAQDSRSEGSPNPRTTVCASVGKKSGVDTSGCVLLQTFRAWAVSYNAFRYVRGIFDGGSQRTFMAEELCKHLKLKCVGVINIALNTFANAKSQPAARRRIVELRLKNQFSDTEVVLSAINIPHICQDIEGSTMDSSFVRACKTSGKDIADELLHPDVITRGGISILIGSDQMWKIMSGEFVRSQENQAMIAINTKLGWTFQGSSTELTATATTSRTMVCVLQADVTQCDDILRSFWEAESNGILDPTSSGTSKSSALDHFENNGSFRHGRYQVELPWKTTVEV
ncbi:uncharacterized protein LOC144148229 [Haemaphysalis longicornis]